MTSRCWQEAHLSLRIPQIRKKRQIKCLLLGSAPLHPTPLAPPPPTPPPISCLKKVKMIHKITFYFSSFILRWREIWKSSRRRFP